MLTLDTAPLTKCPVVAAQIGTNFICHASIFLLCSGFEQHGHGADYQGPTWKVRISALIMMLYDTTIKSFR